ncbi:MAG: hypothetical protein OEZ34_08120, partial [Spirochaetia bacterium]|nr:hypothetical protein [Spirochaetia bacterium]
MQYIPDVKILCGEGMHFGTGHSERMIVLKSLLDRHFLKTELHFTEKLNTIPEEFLSYDKALIQPLLILDIRDADLNSIQNRPAVILDN